MPAKKKQRKEMNVQVLRRPGGAWERLPDGGKGRQLWKNQGGRRTLTPFGRQRLAGWQDLTVHVPVLEYEFENELRGYNPSAKNVRYPVSEQAAGHAGNPPGKRPHEYDGPLGRFANVASCFQAVGP